MENINPKLDDLMRSTTETIKAHGYAWKPGAEGRWRQALADAVKTFPCQWCRGSGKFYWNPEDKASDPDLADEECAACHGTGKVERQLELHEINYR